MIKQNSLIPFTGLSILAGIIVLSSPYPISSQAEKFTVQINGENTGSGTIINRDLDQNKYTVLTSWHVVKYPGEYSVTTFDNKKHKISGIHTLPDMDLALVEFTSKSPGKKPYQIADFGDSKNITAGASFYVSGYRNPRSRRPKRNYLFQDANILSLQSLAEEGYRIVHDQALIPGTSGGAIVDQQARIIGVNGILTKEGTDKQNFGFGIPIQFYQARKEDFVPIIAQKKQKLTATSSNFCIEEETEPVNLQQNELTTKIDLISTSPASHFGDVKTAAIKNNMIVTGSEDKTLKIWNRETRELQNTLTGHTAAVTGVKITEQNIISSSYDGTIRFWDLVDHSTECILPAHSSSVNTIAVSQNGKFLVSGGGDKTIKIWDLNSKKLLNTIEAKNEQNKQGHGGSIYSIAISEDNRKIISGSGDKTIKVWELETGKLISTLVDQRTSRQLTRKAIKRRAKSNKDTKVKPFQVSHEASVDSLAISSKNSNNQKFIISGASDNLIKIWELETGKLKRTLKGHKSSVRDLELVGNILISADNNYETVKVWDLRTGSAKGTFNSNNYFWFSSLAISDDGKTLVSASQDEAIKVVDIATGQREQPLRANTNSILTVAIGDNHIFHATRNNTITVKNPETGEIEYSLQGHTADVTSLAVWGNFLVSASKDKTIRIWNLTTWELERTIRNFSDPITRSIAISEDGQKIVTGSYRTIKIWDLATGKLEQLLDAHNDGVNAIAIRGDYIVSGGGDKTIKVRSLATGELQYPPLKSHKASITSIALSQDQIFSTSYDKTIKVWDLNTGKLEETLTDHDAAVNSLAISDNILVSGSRDGIIETRNLTTNKLEHVIQAHPASVNSVAIKGDTIVSGSSDNTIKIWQIKSGR